MRPVLMPVEADICLEDEQRIVWVQPAKAFPYVRETREWVRRNKSALPEARCGLVAFAQLKEDTAKKPRGWYARRVWYVQLHDAMYFVPGRGPYDKSGTPGEGVKPSSIVAGKPTVKGREGVD